MSLAIVVNTCDYYHFAWKAWWHYLKKNWDPKYPIYFITNGTKDIDLPIKKTIRVDIQEVDLWSKRVSEGIKQVLEDDIFFLMEDLFITKPFKESEFKNIYDFFKRINADALRITDTKYLTVHNTNFYVNNINIQKLDQRSRYLISYSPNIWKKSFLLYCLKENHSPWQGEMEVTKNLFDSGRDIYVYKKLDWYCNTCRQGKIVDEAKKLFDYE